MANLPIPKEFMLHGHTIKVINDPKLLDTYEAVGLADYWNGEIRLLPSLKDRPRSRTDIEQTYMHEVVHHCLYQMQHKLRSNEKFVDTLAQLLHQALTTGKGTLNIKSR